MLVTEFDFNAGGEKKKQAMQELQGISIFPQQKSLTFYRAQMSSGQRQRSLWVLSVFAI